MSINNLIKGKIKLRSEVSVIPDEGLAVSQLRVELVEEEKPDSAWIAELNVLGNLPWHKGEERQVKMRIMSNEFADYVASEHPSLLVKHGSEVLGDVEFE